MNPVFSYQKIIEFCNGNKGALECLMAIMKMDLSDQHFINMLLEKYTFLRGPSLYVLYSDICDKKVNKILTVLQCCPKELIEKAVEKQRDPGKLMIQDYLDELEDFSVPAYEQ